MQKYILGARLTYRDRGLEVLAGPTAMRRAFDADGKVVGEWQDCNAMTVVDATEHDATLAAKDRDLADANHALLLANNNADAFKRVAEQRQGEIERLRRAVEWCLQLGVTKTVGRLLDHYDAGLIVPAEFADIIKPTTGASNG